MTTIKQHCQIIGIVGFGSWLSVVLCLHGIKAWCERVIYCHHNARALADMEYRFGCVLTECTRGMSKAYYDLETMRAEILDFMQERYDEGYKDATADAKADH